MRYEFANFGTEFWIQEHDDAKKCLIEMFQVASAACLSDMFSVLIKNECLRLSQTWNSRSRGSYPQSSEK